MAILFFEEDIKFALKNKNKHKTWLREIASNNGFQIIDLNYIFCSDEYLFQMNVKYLNHNTFTDIITFDNSEKDHQIEGDVFVSIERIVENAKTQNIDFTNELLRVLSHGLLHLMGYADKTEKDKNQMRDMEEKSIALYKN